MCGLIPHLGFKSLTLRHRRRHELLHAGRAFCGGATGCARFERERGPNLSGSGKETNHGRSSGLTNRYRMESYQRVGQGRIVHSFPSQSAAASEEQPARNHEAKPRSQCPAGYAGDQERLIRAGFLELSPAYESIHSACMGSAAERYARCGGKVEVHDPLQLSFRKDAFRVRAAPYRERSCLLTWLSTSQPFSVTSTRSSMRTPKRPFR